MNKAVLPSMFTLLLMSPALLPLTTLDFRGGNIATLTPGALTSAHSFSTGPAASAILSKEPPLYAFNGAYANYNITVSGFAIHGYRYSTFVGYVVNGLDLNSRTFSVLYNYGGEFSSFSSAVTASFDSPSPLPAVSSPDLVLLNRGDFPVDMVIPPGLAGNPPVSTVTPNITISVPAGRFTVDEIAFANGNKEWVAVDSGLVMKETGSFPGSPLPVGIYGTMELVSTNIPAGGPAPNYSLYIANGVALALVLLVIVLASRMLDRRQRGALRLVVSNGAA